MSVFVRMLPYYEQGPLYNAYNSSTTATHPSNVTLAGVGISALWCPSDGTISDSVELEQAQTRVSRLIPWDSLFWLYAASRELESDADQLWRIGGAGCNQPGPTASGIILQGQQ